MHAGVSCSDEDIFAGMVTTTTRGSHILLHKDCYVCVGGKVLIKPRSP